MNIPTAEKKPNITISFTPEKTDLLQILAVQLSEVLEDRVDGEGPIPEDIELEIMATFAEEEIEGEEDPVSTSTQNNKDEQRQRVFLKAGFDGIAQAILVRDSAVVGDNFYTSPECTIGRNSVIGDNCSIVSPVGRRVHIGDNAVIADGCMLGAIDLKKWGYSRPLKNEAGETVKDEKGEIVKEWVEYETHIGDRVSMAKGSKVRPHSTLGHDVTMEFGSEVGKSVSRTKKDGHWVENQKNPKKQTFVGNHCVIGMGSIIESGAQIGSGYWIADGVTVPGTVKLPDNDTGKDIIIDDKFLDKYLFNQRRTEREKARV
ncbi:MAG: hypothetical protein AAB423_00620 [Patescibacteria group bacterium]